MGHIDPAVWQDQAVRRALATRDVSRLYSLLLATGVSQRRISQLTEQSPSEVSEIIAGRQVQSYAVLERIAVGLGVSRGAMGLAYAGGVAATADGDPDGERPAKELTEDMKRRAFLAAASIALWGRPTLGDILELPDRPDSPTPLPSRLGDSDVAAMRDLTAGVRDLARTHGGYADLLGPVARRAERLLTVPASPTTHRAMVFTVAELHTVAGWAGFDAHLDDQSRYHLGRAMELSAVAVDPYGAAYALYLAGVVNEERGHPDDALKLFQLGRVRLMDARRDDRSPALDAWLRADSAGALVNLGRRDDASEELAAARRGWQPAGGDDAAELDFVSALVNMGLGRLDPAEQLAASAVRHRETSSDRRASLVERITWTQLHVISGEPNGLSMAERVIRDVNELRSQRARDRLAPLADALQARRDGRELAHLARRVAAVTA